MVQYRVKFTTAKPVAELPLLITNKNTFIVQNGATTATLRTKGAGTGPFIPVDFKPRSKSRCSSGIRTTGRRASRRPLPAAVRHPGAQLDAGRVQTGQVDFSQQVAYEVVPALKIDPRVKLTTTGAATSMAMPMWVDTAPFDKVEVRQALKKVVDREQIVQRQRCSATASSATTTPCPRARRTRGARRCRGLTSPVR